MENEILELVEQELEIAGLRRTKGRHGDPDRKKKRVRGMSARDREMLLEDSIDWHLQGDSWPAGKRDTTQARAYFARAYAEEGQGLRDTVAEQMQKWNAERDQLRRRRLDRLQTLLSEVGGSGGKSKLGPKARKQEIKKLMHKIHGHYFSQLFNFLKAPDDAGSAGDGSGESKQERTSPAETKQASGGESNSPERRPLVPTRSRAASGGGRVGNSMAPRANIMRQSATVDYPGTEQNPSVDMGRVTATPAEAAAQAASEAEAAATAAEAAAATAAAAAAAAAVTEGGVDAAATGTESKTPADVVVHEDDGPDEFNNTWDNSSEDDDAFNSAAMVRRLDSNDDPLEDSMASEGVTEFGTMDVQAQADQYEQEGESDDDDRIPGTEEEKKSRAQSLADDAVSQQTAVIRRQGASPGNRRERSSGGGILDLEELDGDDLGGSWDMDN